MTPTMNSFNHCSLGCVGEWFFTGIAGINAIEPGFKKFMIRPFIPDELTYAEASFKTNYGIVKSEWKKDEENLTMKIQVPFNTSAVIVIPFNVYELSKTHSILRKENNCTYIEVGFRQL